MRKFIISKICDFFLVRFIIITTVIIVFFSSSILYSQEKTNCYELTEISKNEYLVALKESKNYVVWFDIEFNATAEKEIISNLPIKHIKEKLISEENLAFEKEDFLENPLKRCAIVIDTIQYFDIYIVNLLFSIDTYSLFAYKDSNNCIKCDTTLIPSAPIIISTDGYIAGGEDCLCDCLGNASIFKLEKVGCELNVNPLCVFNVETTENTNRWFYTHPQDNIDNLFWVEDCLYMRGYYMDDFVYYKLKLIANVYK